MEQYTYIILIAVISSPWVFLLVMIFDKRRESRMWRETLVYLRSASAYEAEDSIDRVHNRSKTALQKGLAKFKKEGENLAEDSGIDMAQDMRAQLQKEYE